MKSKDKLFEFSCTCKDEKPLEKKLRIRDLPAGSPKRKEKTVEFDVFCHWCGKYIMVELTDDFDPKGTLRE